MWAKGLGQSDGPRSLYRCRAYKDLSIQQSPWLGGTPGGSYIEVRWESRLTSYA